ncbi:MAG: hypothetical protein BZY88_16275 [SAR202 cluster bacterium Io17-Chloro-G9]|nr:MAG: hypothetical protein BZY88_16275 [SAR202 cluster bacterium Io17-Chloro-G9]
MARIAVIGTGLIGTSLALAIRQSQLKDIEMVGTDYDSQVRAAAQKTGAFHRMEGRLSSAVRDAEVVVMATPVLAMRDMMEALAAELPDGCVLTDVGSSKGEVLKWAGELLPKHVNFVGGHPMAGKETSGPENADPNLFRGKPYCIIPSPYVEQQAVSTITTLAEAVGAKPYFINVDEHDSFVAAVSHLPFILSTALMETASKSANWDDIAQLASSGFHDMSRLAAGDSVMHRDIAVSNREPIVAWIDSFIRELYEIRNMLNVEEEPDPATVEATFEHASTERARWLAGLVSPAARTAGPTPDIPTFGESMGEMLMGRKGVEAQKRFMGNFRDGKRKKK